MPNGVRQWSVWCSPVRLASPRGGTPCPQPARPQTDIAICQGADRIINLGQKVFLSVEKVDHLNRRWVQFQLMEHFSLHRYGPDKPDKDHGAKAAAAAAVLVGWTVGKWLARRNDEAIAERRRQAELRARGSAARRGPRW